MAKAKKDLIINGIVIPRKIKAFTVFGFIPNGVTPNSKTGGDEYHGDCLFCGREDKLYINEDTQQWACKSAYCDKYGNIYGFLKAVWEHYAETDAATPEEWARLTENRGLSEERLRSEGIVWDGSQWLLPVVNSKGTMLHLYRYKTGGMVYAVPEIPHALFGLTELTDPERIAEPICLAEGPWDRIALKYMLETSGENAVVVGIPGAGVLKDEWLAEFSGREILACYDNDDAGRKATATAYKKTKGSVSSFRYVAWPEGLPEGYDIRDLLASGNGWEMLSGLLAVYKDAEGTESQDEVIESLPPLSGGGRPALSSLLDVYRAELCMSPDLIDAVRCMLAVVLSNSISGDPLWLHIVGPPGAGKTQIISSLKSCPQVVFRSTLTAHTLVSGFGAPGTPDPSLIPLLIGPPSKVFVLKDFTEILQMNGASKEEVYATLRGAYDGSIDRQFGNRVFRKYEGRFSVVTGVTPSVFKEQSTSLGERFLIFYMPKDPIKEIDVIMAAIEGVGKESVKDETLQKAVAEFLGYSISVEDYPEISHAYKLKIASLAQLVSMLRATVEKDRTGGTERVHYRPEPEVGTRLAKQLIKLLMGLGLQHESPKITEDDYRIVVRVAVNTCVGWNLETFRYLADPARRKTGATVDEISEALQIPLSTLRDHIGQMVMLRVLKRTQHKNDGSGGVGNLVFRYHLTTESRGLWNNADIGKYAKNVKVTIPMKPPSEKFVMKAINGDLRARERVSAFVEEMEAKGVPETRIGKIRKFVLPSQNSQIDRNGARKRGN